MTPTRTVLVPHFAACSIHSRTHIPVTLPRAPWDGDRAQHDPRAATAPLRAMPPRPPGLPKMQPGERIAIVRRVLAEVMEAGDGNS